MQKAWHVQGMNVKFLSTTYRPTDEEMRMLHKMQEVIHFTRIQYLKEISYDSPRNKAARMAELPLMYRARWEVISNDLDDDSE